MQPGLHHHPPGAFVDRHRLGPDPTQPDRVEGVPDQRPRPLGGQPSPPRRAAQPVAQLGLRAVLRRVQREPTQELAGLPVVRRPPTQPGIPVVLGQQPRQLLIAHGGRRGRDATGEEAHHLGVAVQLDQRVHVGHGQPPQPQPLGPRRHTRAIVTHGPDHPSRSGPRRAVYRARCAEPRPPSRARRSGQRGGALTKSRQEYASTTSTGPSESLLSRTPTTSPRFVATSTHWSLEPLRLLLRHRARVNSTTLPLPSTTRSTPAVATPARG